MLRRSSTSRFTIVSEMKLVVIVIGVHAMVMCVTCQSAPQCYNESQHGPSTTSPNADIQHDWVATEGDGVYNATFLCLDENYNVIVRNCFNGMWYPKGVRDCYDFACPKPFLQEGRDKCSYTAILRSADECPSITSIIAGHKNAACATKDNCGVPRKCIYSAANFLERPSSGDLNVTLIFHPVERKLLLTVYSTEVLDEDLTRCYANHVDPEQLQNRKLINISKIYDSRRSEIHGRHSLRNFSVYELEVEGEPRQYWCQVYQTSRFRPLTTGRTVAYSRKTGNEYSLRVNAFKFMLKDALRHFCRRCRAMEVLSYNQVRSIIVLHLTANATEELAVLKGEFQNRTSPSVRLLDVKSTEFCPPDVTVVGKGDETLLHWKATALGAWARPTGYFGNNVMRKCQGDFLHGAEWGEIQGHPLNATKQPPNILNEVKDLMSSNATKLTTTDALLRALEDYVKHNADELQKIKKSNLLVHHESDVSALALYKEGFKSVHASFEDISTSGLELGVFLPDTSAKLLVTVFRNDRLFPGGKIHAGSDIVRVETFKNDAYLKTPIILLFKTRGAFKRTTCAFWDYGAGTDGHWSTLGADYVATVAENYTACAFSHQRGYFAVVVLSGERVIWEDFEESTENDGSKRFNKILFMVYGFSAVGVAAIVGVIVTAVLVKWCRRKDRRK